MRTGAPTKAVTMPALRPLGRATTRPTTSASVSSAAPPRADSTSSRRLSGPMSMRTAWGTMSPTKPIGPTSAVVVAQAMTPAAEASRRVRMTLTPSPVAISSPSARELSGRATTTASTPAATRKGAPAASDSHVPRPTEPTCQTRKSFRPWARGSMIALMSELMAALVATPARASLTGVAPPGPVEPTA